MASPPPSLPLDPAAVFRAILKEFLALDDSKIGSMTVHFTAGRRIRKVEWRKLADPEADTLDVSRA